MMKMELKKRTGLCTEDAFWECVAEIDWPANNEKGMTKRDCLLAWSVEFGVSFRKILEKKETAVHCMFESFEENHLSKAQRDKYYLGDDGLGDFCSHVVGLGREVFDAEMADPTKLYKRACKSDYVEKFGYCIPYEPTHPDATFDEFMDAQERPKTEKEWEGSYHFRDYETYEDFTGTMRQAYRHARMGDWGMIEAEHYEQRARSNHGRIAVFVAELVDLSPWEAKALEYATLLMKYLGDLMSGKTDEALVASASALEAWWGLFHIVEDLGELREKHSQLLPMISRGQYGGENLINDHRIYMGGLERFKCQHHLKEHRAA
jgi:hypothetical protein